MVRIQPNLAWWYSGTKSFKSRKTFADASLVGKYDVIKPFLVLFQIKIRVPYLLSNWAEIWHRVDSEALISNLSQKIDISTFWRGKCHFLQKTDDFAQALLDKIVAMATFLVAVNWKLFQMIPYIIILKVRNFHQSSRARHSKEKNCKGAQAWIGLKLKTRESAGEKYRSKWTYLLAIYDVHKLLHTTSWACFHFQNCYNCI